MGRLKNLILVFLAIVVTAVLLRRLLGTYALVVPLLYMFFDVNWSLRVTWIVLYRKIISRASKPDFLEVFETNVIVLPSDMDLNLHMNNSRYLRECDFGRINFWFTSGMMDVMRKNNCSVTIATASVRYRRSLELFQKVFLKTRVLAWDDSAFYLEQRFTGGDGFVYAVTLTKNKVIQGNKKERFISPGELVQQLSGWNMQSPPLPHDLHLWIQYNSASSAMLKNAL